MEMSYNSFGGSGSGVQSIPNEIQEKDEAISGFSLPGLFCSLGLLF